MLRSAGSAIPLALGLPGRFNLANAALAVAAAHHVQHVPTGDAAARLSTVRSVAGRLSTPTCSVTTYELCWPRTRPGWLELLDLIGQDPHPLVLILNAEGVDGRDPSWIYDVSFAALGGRAVIVQGRRATDLLVRLQHDGVAATHVPGSLGAALETLPAGPVDVVGNYTAFRRAVREVRRA